jgi:hypothetical protein
MCGLKTESYRRCGGNRCKRTGAITLPSAYRDSVPGGRERERERREKDSCPAFLPYLGKKRVLMTLAFPLQGERKHKEETLTPLKMGRWLFKVHEFLVCYHCSPYDYVGQEASEGTITKKETSKVTCLGRQ